jgi:ectoine hydroxylase-related dioxygenase (phytanoyl-CoA dioxygenase family)
MTVIAGRAPRPSEDGCQLEDLIAVLDVRTDLADYPYAAGLVQEVLIYDTAALHVATDRTAVQDELVRALTEGPGLVVFRGAFANLAAVDRVTAAFDAMIADERAAGATAGDHFATPGANDRIWNALEKLAVHDPDAFVDYYSNDILALVSEAWLGPGYQVTSQPNVVRPGGKAQDPHRDYHLGFLSNELAARYPEHVHRLSPVLTLQGAVAHSDMPVASGPTMYLPHSQKYLPGYLAWRRPEFRDYFLDHFAQLPLAKGDAAFFNPALFHGAGSNISTDVQRMANLLQVSSAFGRAMEAVDRSRVVRAVYPALLRRARAGASPASLANAVAAVAEGYPFPTNLDRDAPVGGLTPPSQAEIVHRALATGTDPAALEQEIAGYDRRHRTAN